MSFAVMCRGDAMVNKYSRRRAIKSAAATVALMGIPNLLESQAPGEGTTRYNYSPKSHNMPLGTARGVHPGRVVWVHDPKAAHWSGDRKSVSDQWWMDSSTDQARVDAMVSLLLRSVTGASTDD